MSLRELSDEELIRRYCSSGDREAVEALVERWAPTIRNVAERIVLRGCLWPRGQDRHEFCKDAIQRASLSFYRSVCTFDFRGSFEGWLSILTRNSVIDEYRKATGRGDEPLPPLDPLDKAEKKSAAEANPTFHSKYWADPAELVRDRELKDVVVKLLALHATTSRYGPRHGQISAEIIASEVWEELSPAEIAELRHCSERTVYRYRESDYPELPSILETRLGITKLEQL